MTQKKTKKSAKRRKRAQKSEKKPPEYRTVDFFVFSSAYSPLKGSRATILALLIASASIL